MELRAEGREPMDIGVRALGWLRNAVVGVFAAALVAGIFEPLYTDEVGWRFQERAGIDGVDKLYNDLCGPGSLAVPPFFMMPVRAYSALFNTAFADPLYVRLSGIGYALLWLVLLLAIVRRIAATRADRTLLTTLGVGLMSLGLMPLLLIWSRPEQPVVLSVTAAILLACGAAGARAAWLRSIGIVLLATVAFSYHLKAIVISPIFLTCLCYASRGRAANLPRLACGAALVAIAGWSAHYWIARLQCTADPAMLAAYSSNNLSFALTEGHGVAALLATVGRLVGNISLVAYFGLPTPRMHLMSDWLAPHQLGYGLSLVWALGLILAWGAAVLLGFVCLFRGGERAWRARRLDARLALAIVTLACLLAWSATQTIRNTYEASFVLPLAMIAVILVLPSLDAGERLARWSRLLATIVGLCALVSMAGVAVVFGPSLARANAQAGYIAEQPLSVPVFGYARLKADILAAGRKCGIDDPARANALMLDDLTYFAFMQSRLPQHQLGVLGLWRGSITDPIAYLRSRGSDGAVLGCHLLPPDLRARARSEGRFCCLEVPK
jgi:hypothetical protein